MAEGGGAKTRRVLLSDTSGEAAAAFLSYLYTAEHFIPQHILSEVAALALRSVCCCSLGPFWLTAGAGIPHLLLWPDREAGVEEEEGEERKVFTCVCLLYRFGVAELAGLCTAHSWSGQPAVGAPGQEGEGRVERFEELLKSMWVEEDEEDGALLPEELASDHMMDEEELEEIYEFASTQRKTEGERHGRERTWGAEVGVPPVEEGAEGRGSRGRGSARLPVRDAGKEAVLGSPDPVQNAEEQRPLGAASRRHLEALPELPEAWKERSEKSLLAVSWGESLELFQQSDSGREPSSDAAEEGAPVKSSTPLGLSQNFSRGRSQVLAGELPASPRRRGGFCSDLSLTLFSPAPPEASEKPCRTEEQGHPKLQRGASEGAAVCRGADDISCTPAAVPPSSRRPVDLKAGPVLKLFPEDKRELGQGKWQVEMVGFPPKEREAFGAMEVDIPCGLGRGSPLLGTFPGDEAAAGGTRIQVPGTPPLSCRGFNGAQAAKLGLPSGPDVQRPGDAEDSCPTPTSVIIPSPKRWSLQGGPPLGPRSPSSPWPSACHGRGGHSAAADVVVILEDSEEEAEAAPQLSRGSSVFQPGPPTYEDDSSHISPVASPEGLVATEGGSRQLDSPAGLLLTRSGTPPGGSHATASEPLPLFGRAEKGGCSSDGGRSRRLDFWGQGDEREILPLAQRLPAAVPVPKTPGEQGPLPGWAVPVCHNQAKNAVQ